MTDEEKTLRLVKYAVLVLLINVGLWALFSPAHAENFPDYGDAVGYEHPFLWPRQDGPPAGKDYVIRNDKGG